MDNRSAIGIDIGGTNMKSGIVQATGKILYEETVPTRAFSGKLALLSQIEELVLAFKERALEQGITLTGVGIGTAGYVNQKGVVEEATNNLPGWSGTRLKEIMEERIKLPVVVDNDVNAMAMGEVWQGAGRSWDDFICIALGTGVGGCLIRNHKPYYGRDGYAGGYGHQAIVFEGHPCTCGLAGCWEQYASVTALKRLTSEIAGASAASLYSPQELFAQAGKGNAIAAAVIDRYGQYIAQGIANLIHIFNPSAIVVGGAITAQGDALFDPVRQYVNQYTLRAYREEPIPIVPAELGNMAGMVGSAKRVLDECVS